MAAPATVSFSKVQLNALESLYNGTNGKEWRWYVDESYFGVHWNFTTTHPNPCTPQKWQGITCSNTICTSSHPCNVVELALPDFRMKGMLPQSISNLTYLTSLDLASNSLYGPIPTTISKLTALTNLQLTSNNFNGSIPSSLSKLIKLRTLNLAQNHLQGSIPPSLYTGLISLTSWIMNNNFLNGEISPLIGVMNSLNEMDFGFNFLGGMIPSNISYCHNLQTLILTSNLFTGSLNNLTNPSLVKLDLSANGFGGSIPVTISQLTNLQHLDLSINQVTSSIPETLYSIKNLTSLLLTENNFRGTLSPHIAQLQQMKLFDIEKNKMHGSLPSNIGDLNASLESLQLGKNDFTGPLPDSLGQLVNLIRFTAGECHFNSTIPQEIGNMTELRYLDLNHNQLNGTIPVGITLLKELNSIDLSNNLLYGTIPSSFGSNSNQMLLNNVNFKKNQLSGSITDCFENLLLLQSLSLSFNNFTGSLSKNFFMNNKQLNFLDLSFNQFTGPIPLDMTGNNQLKTIYLQNNQFNGSLPSQIGNYWNQLLVINLENNEFTGNIPNSFCEINKINVLYMSNNRFHGRLPSCLTNLTQLSRVELINNHFTGQLPEIFDKFRRLSKFLASDNQFFGTLPITLGQASLLDTLYIENNLLTGTIPSSYGTDLIHLRFLKLGSNQLNGTLPIVLGQLQQFEVLSVTNNQLTGEIYCQVKNSSISFLKTLLLAYNQFSNTIPRELCQLYGLEDLSLYNNYFIDVIPNCFNNISSLSNISLSSNYLYSTIPNSLGNVILLSELYLDNNLLTGRIPTSFSHLFELQILSLSNNDFTGSLPVHFNELRKISFINISFNHLTGPLSNRFIRMEHLGTLLVNDNRFSGSIEQLFNSTIRLRINTIDLSSNQLTGTIPSYVFNNSRQLLSFAAIDNCFSGKIPEEICNAETLTAIALDGLHTSSACTQKILPFSKAKSYSIPINLQGSIPFCVYKMKNLKTLHLSGNGLTGTLPTDLTISSSLTDLSLSHNRLYGSIPTIFQEHNWINLDLSFNKFNGILLNNNVSYNDNYYNSMNSSLTLEINRLSGSIPSSLLTMNNINILKGNIFSCSNNFIQSNDNNHDDLPVHDSNTLTYSCGSDSVNSSLLVWLLVITLSFGLPLLLIGLSIVFNKKETEHKWITWIKKNFLLLQTWWEVYQSIHLSNFYLQPLDYIYEFGIVIKGIRTMTIRLTLFIVVFLLPVHIGLSTVYGTYTYQYAWVLSMAYLSGFLPAVVLFFCLFLFLVFIGQNLAFLATSNEQQAPLNSSSSSASSSMRQQSTSSSSIFKPKAVRYEFLFSWKLLRKNMSKSLLIEMIGLGIFNCLITLVVQFSFVFAVTSASSLNNRSINLISFVISIFFVFWNNMIVIGLFSKRIRYLQDQFRLTSSLPHTTSTPEVTSNPLASDHAFPLQQVHHENEESRPTTVPGSRDTGIASTTFTLSGNQLSSTPTIISKMISKEDNSTNLNIYYSNKEDNLFNEERRIFFLTYLLTFNNVIAPLIAALFISPDCFYYLLVTPPSITTNYNVVVCDKEVGSYIYEGICLDYNILTPSVSFIPPFLYSYQCSSTLLPIFASFNLYRYFFTGVLIPISRIVLKLFQEWYYKRYGSTSIFYLISLMMLSPSRILYDDDVDASKTTTNPEDGKVISQLTEKELKRKEEREKINLTFFNKRQFINRDYIVLPIISEFTVFITFGAIFPPLAIVVCYTICITTLFIQTIIGRVVVISRTQSAVKKYLSKMNEECRNFRRLFLQSIPLISILASFFWGFFLFDILGDSDSSSVSSTVWIFIMMGFAPIISYVAEVLLDKVFDKVCSNSTERDVTDEEKQEEKSNTKLPTFQEESSHLSSSDDKDVI